MAEVFFSQRSIGEAEIPPRRWIATELPCQDA